MATDAAQPNKVNVRGIDGEGEEKETSNRIPRQDVDSSGIRRARGWI